jgi:hypothetical protein
MLNTIISSIYWGPNKDKIKPQEDPRLGGAERYSIVKSPADLIPIYEIAIILSD